LRLLEEGQNHLIVHFTYLRQTIGKEFVFLSFLYIKLFELGVKVAFYDDDDCFITINSGLVPFIEGLCAQILYFRFEIIGGLHNRSAVAHNKVDLLKFPRRSTCSERTDDAFVLLNCFYFFHLYKPLIPVC